MLLLTRKVSKSMNLLTTLRGNIAAIGRISSNLQISLDKKLPILPDLRRKHLSHLRIEVAELKRMVILLEADIDRI